MWEIHNSNKKGWQQEKLLVNFERNFVNNMQVLEGLAALIFHTRVRLRWSESIWDLAIPPPTRSQPFCDFP